MPSLMTHHHHGLALGNLRQLFCRQGLRAFGPFGGQAGGVEELFYSRCLDAEIHVLRYGPGRFGIFDFVELRHHYTDNIAIFIINGPAAAARLDGRINLKLPAVISHAAVALTMPLVTFMLLPKISLNG